MGSVFDPDSRMKPFGEGCPYGHGFDPNPDLSFLKSHPRWWNARAEEALRDSIRHWQWAWLHGFGRWFVDNVRQTHQLVATEYAAAQAKHLGLLDGLRLPVIGKPCLQCGEMFREDGVAGSCLARFGNVTSIDYCNPCMVGVLDAPVREPNQSFGKEHTIGWLEEVAKRLQRIPSQSFPSIEEFRAADRNERRHIVALCQERPSVERVKELFGSWLAALIAADLLENGTRRLLLGTQCLARDGHVCFSLVFVEFLGLKGQPDYDEKTALKKQVCESAGIKLLLIEPNDLASRTTLSKKIAKALPR